MVRAVLWVEVSGGVPTNAPASVGDQQMGSNGRQSDQQAARSPSGALLQAALLGKPGQTLIRDCVLGARCTVHPGSQIHGAIIADGCIVETGNELSGGLKLWPHRTLPAQTITF
jgi:hypothetical protein